MDVNALVGISFAEDYWIRWVGSEFDIAGYTILLTAGVHLLSWGIGIAGGPYRFNPNKRLAMIALGPFTAAVGWHPQEEADE